MNTLLPISQHGRRLLPAMMTFLLCVATPRAFAEIAEEELTRFVQGYLSAAQQSTPEAEVAHYARRVRYFNNGVVDQDFVAADQERYYQRWPLRSFELLDGPVIIEQDGDAATARFTIRYEVSGAGRRATGATENTMRVQRFNEGLRIVTMSERKVNSKHVSRQSEKPRAEFPARETDPSVIRPKTPPAPPSRDVPDSRPREKAPSPKPQAPPSSEALESQMFKPGGTAKKTEDSKGAPGEAPQSNGTSQTATPVPDMPGFVYPPGTEQTPRNMIDVRGYASGQKVKDPRTGQIFLVP